MNTARYAARIFLISFASVFWLSLGASVALLLSSCGSKEQAQAADIQSAPASVSAGSVKKVVALGRVEPEGKITPLSMDVSGVVKNIYAKEGSVLKQGEQILELDHALESAKLLAAQAKLAAQSSEVKAANAALVSAELKMHNLKEKFERVQQIFETGAETRQNFDNTKTDYETALREVERLKAAAQATSSRLAEASADVRVATVEVQRRILRAPSDGMLLSLEPTVGSSVASGKALADFAPAGAVTVLCEVDELFVDKLQVGQKAAIRPQGSTDVIASGEVIMIAPYLKKKSIFSDEAGALEDRRVREVRVKITSDTSALLFNSRVECVIQMH
jgi:multidrug efflux pump subunit AcrA (membrane-fusion protein)